MKLYDEIRGPPPAGTPTVVDVTDVARIALTEPPGKNAPEDMSIFETYPCMLPPWPLVFYEYKTPRAMIYDGKSYPIPAGRIGVLAHTLELTPEGLEAGNARLRGAGVERELSHTSEVLDFTRQGGRYLTSEVVYIVRAGERAPDWDEPDAIMFRALDRDGHYIDGTSRIRMTDWQLPELPSKEEAEQSMSIAQFYAHPAFMASALLNCKNVSTVDHPVPEGVARARVRKGKPPGVIFKTLVVKVPGTKEPARFSLPEGERRANARHIVRGHFATYTKERPLFGKYEGTFYHPMHVWGRNKDRTVIKDYHLIGKEDAA